MLRYVAPSTALVIAETWGMIFSKRGEKGGKKGGGKRKRKGKRRCKENGGKFEMW